MFTQSDSEAGAYSFREKTIRFTVEAIVGDVVTLKRLARGSSPVGGARKKSCSKEQEFFQLYSPSASYIASQ